MSAGKIFRNAGAIYGKNVIRMFALMLIQLVPRVIAALPLLFLKTEHLKPLAAISVLLYILLVIPARQNEAQVLRNLCGNGKLGLSGILYMGDYGPRLGKGLKTGLFLLIWALPFLAATACLVLAYNGVLMDAVTMIRTIMNLGNEQWVSVLLASQSSATIRGIIVVLAGYLMTLLPLLLGCAVHSWRRFRRDDEPMRFRGRGKLVLCRLMGALTGLPFVIAAAIIGKGYIHELTNSLSGLLGGKFSIPSADNLGWAILIAFLVLYVPRIPLAQLIPAECVEEDKR